MNIREPLHLKNKQNKVVCFGELLLRICPDLEGEWLATNNVSVYVAGAEANVATDIGLWGLPTSYITVLPDNFLSMKLIDYFRSKHVDISRILLYGQRMGIFYLPKGKDIKNATIIYDRKNSSFSDLRPGMLDWDSILADAGWLHVSAITPALSDTVFRVCKEAFEVASKKNIIVSIDLNYRAKLWESRNPVEVISELLPYCDVVMGNIWSAEKMLGIPNHLSKNGQLEKRDYVKQAEITSRTIIELFPEVKVVANTFRFDDGEQGINYYGTLYSNGRLYVSNEYRAAAIIDKVGSGDCFMAGLIYAFIKSFELDYIVDFAAAAAFTKLFVESDVTTKCAAEIDECVRSGRLHSL